MVPQANRMAHLLEIYGWLGLPMFAMFVLSAAWSAMLAVIQCVPTTVANRLMGTGSFDFGEFWLLPHPDLTIAVPSAIALGIFAAGYSGLALLMLFPSRLRPTELAQVQPITSSGAPPALLSRGSSKMLWSWRQPQSGRPPRESVTTEPSIPRDPQQTQMVNGWKSRTQSSMVAVKRQVESPVLALPKLVFQTTTLLTYMQEGFPVALIITYALLLFVNWLISCYRIHREFHVLRQLFLTQVFNSFDLFFAVFAPLQVLIYAYYSFSFDRDVFNIRLETFTKDSFGRTARLFADPTEISLFRIAFQHLQLSTTSDLLIKCALNAFSIYKWHFILEVLVQNAHHASTGESIDTTLPRGSRKRWHIARRWFLVATFFSAGLGILVHAMVALVTSQRVCEPYLQCKVPRYQWNVGSTHCSCIVFVEREPKLKTMAEWLDPPDISASLASLAFTGHLKIIQVVNRQLPTLPEELRNCTQLTQLILIYSKIRTIPEWANRFQRLEYLHIEGDLTTKQLVSMPRDLFVNMHQLMFLHLGCHLELPALPDLNYLVRLEYLVLAMLHSITVVPPIDRLVLLKQLSIIDNVRLNTLPRVATLTSLITFALLHRLPVCCNGYLPMGCNLEAFSCLDRTSQGEPFVTCSSDHIPAEDYEFLRHIPNSICPPNYPFDLKDVAPTLASTDISCGGVQFRQCTLNGASGLCYPARMMPISCQLDPDYVRMRRLEIERHLGEACDPVEESWLGCS